MDWPKPRLVVSACLGFAAVRYNGAILSDGLVEALRAHAEFMPVCPEMEIGLGVPRPPIHLVRQGEGVMLWQPDPGRDLTGTMEAFAQRFLEALPPVEGFILKNRSPSCALKDAKVHARPEGGGVVGRGPGLFARRVLDRFPLLPAEDEGRLSNPILRAHFLTRVFALARLRALGEFRELQAFHARYKLLLMAYSPKGQRALGRLLGEARGRDFLGVRRAYEEGFLSYTQKPPTPAAWANALEHAYGYFKGGLTPREKAHFLALLQDFRQGRRGLEALIELLRSWAYRFEEGYVEGQALLEPFPSALAWP